MMQSRVYRALSEKISKLDFFLFKQNIFIRHLNKKRWLFLWKMTVFVFFYIIIIKWLDKKRLDWYNYNGIMAKCPLALGQAEAALLLHQIMR